MSTTLNNTRVRNILDCPSSSNDSGLIGCEGASGSVYSTTAGTFQEVYNLKDWNVTSVYSLPIRHLFSADFRSTHEIAADQMKRC